MPRSQRPLPREWLITDERLGDLRGTIRRLRPGTGVLVRQHELARPERQRLLRYLRQRAGQRRLTVVAEADGRTARVHDARELRGALLRQARLIFLSPMHATRTHPGWSPLPRMKAAALLRLSPVPLLALGGMNHRRFLAVRPLGFAGWAAIDAWLKPVARKAR